MKLAIVGTGKIVHEAFKALQDTKNIQVTALYCRAHSIETAQELAAQYHVENVFTDYDELLKTGDMDMVYIGLVNSVHYDYSCRALLAGKSVIIEKPICSDVAQTQALVDLARQRHLYVFEAVTFLHASFFKEIQSVLPDLGPIKIVQCNYSKYSSRYDRYLAHDVAPAFDPLCSGGALYDLGVYNLHFVIGLLGYPESVHYTANKGFNGVDTSGIALLSYPTFVATCTAAKDSYSPCFMMIQGERGWLRVEGSPDDFQQLEIHTPKETRVISLLQKEHRMVDEFNDFQKIFSESDYERMNKFLEHSLNVVKAVEEARRHDRL
jgi:predicted dehydrogenase